MTQPVKINFKIYQGSTFSQVLRWESSEKGYATITAISKAAPMVITAPSHGVPTGWRFSVSSPSSMKELQTIGTIVASSTTTDTITVNSVNSTAFSTYTAGGVVEYNQPIDLTGFSARMQIRSRLEDASIIKELTTENGGIIIDNTLKTIKLVISATDTAGFIFQTGVYSIELVNGTTVTPFASGTVTLVKEVTR